MVKSRLMKQGFKLAPDVDIAAALSLQMLIIGERRGELLVLGCHQISAPIRTSQRDQAVYFQDAMNLSECIHRLAQMLKHGMGKNDIKRFSGKWQLAQGTDLKSDVLEILRRGGASSDLDL